MHKKKGIIFRADGNSKIGLGHVYRLFSLVETVKQEYDFFFLTKEESTTSIVPHDYNLKIIPKHIGLDDEPSWLQANFPSGEFIVIADGYQFTTSYQKAIKKVGYKLIYIDDLAIEHFFADLVINHSPQVSVKDFRTEKYTNLALGTDFALLRPKFLEYAKKPPTLKPLDKAFVNFGGSDMFGLTHTSVKALLEIDQIKEIHIVLGAANLNESLYALQEKFSSKILIHKNLSEIELIKVMKTCSFAIVPTSTILFELFCVKMPIISGYFVDNQAEAFKSFKKRNLVFGIDKNLKELTQNKLRVLIKKLIDVPNHLEVLKNQHKMIDGKQSLRHLKLIKQFT